MATIYTDSNAKYFNNFLPRAHGCSPIELIIEHALTAVGNGIINIISVDSATPGVKIIEHPRRFKVSKTASKEKLTVCETSSYKKTESSFPWHEEHYTEIRIPIPALTNTKNSNEDIPDSKKIQYDSRKSSLEDDYSSLNETTPLQTALLTSTDDINMAYIIEKLVRHEKTLKETLYPER